MNINVIRKGVSFNYYHHTSDLQPSFFRDERDDAKNFFSSEKHVYEEFGTSLDTELYPFYKQVLRNICKNVCNINIL